MIYRSKAPLRIGFAGGGTDVSPYSDIYGGAVLNATISLYARASIEPIPDKKIILQTLDRGEKYLYDLAPELPIDGCMDILKGVYNHISAKYGIIKEGFRLSTSVDAPAGSGLGTSSTLVVAVIGAFTEWLKLPLGNYDIAHMAYEIERSELNIAGGKQDQYTAAFGGFNYMEFFGEDKVIVNPLRIDKTHINELENNLLLYYTSTSRFSAEIIKEQQLNVQNDNKSSIEAMHVLKQQAMEMKEALLTGRIDRMGELLHEEFMYKKRMARSISNSGIDEIYKTALESGALGGKISGAGGGGFMVFYCPDIKRYDVIKALEKFNGKFKLYNFVKDGLFTWSI
ncbi:MAG: dehydrogenase [Rikenellaceae bacterium]|nr:dehydrogenase [Rikenellaceae bacterium]